MLSFKAWLVDTLTADTTLQGYLTAEDGTMNVYPADIDLTPERLPAVTYADAGMTVLSTPQGVHVGIVQLDIWSTTNALEVEQIYTRIQTLLNFQHSMTVTQAIDGTLWFVRENGARDMSTPGRRIWRKSVDLKVWVNRSDDQ